MKKEIMYTENAPEKKFLWLHYKNGNLVLEAFGNSGWESVGDDSKDASNEIADLSEQVAKIQKGLQPQPIEAQLFTLTDKCSKKELIATIEVLKQVLVKAGIMTL